MAYCFLGGGDLEELMARGVAAVAVCASRAVSWALMSRRLMSHKLL